MVGAGSSRVFDDLVAVIGFHFLVETTGGEKFVSCEVGESFAVEALLLTVRIALAGGLAADGRAPVLVGGVLAPAVFAYWSVHTHTWVVMGDEAPGAIGGPQRRNKFLDVFA